MDELLGGLGREATVESAGVFTLDRERALRTVQRFQLPGPQYCALAMVASAVVGGAKSVDYLHLHNRRTLNLNGLGFDFSQCDAALANDIQAPSLNYLTLALRSASRMTGQMVGAATWDGQSGALLKTVAGRLQATPLSEPPWEDWQARTRMDLAPVTPWLAIAGRTVRGLIGLPAEVDLVADVLKAYCCYSPVPVRVGGRELTITHQARWRVVTVVNGQRLPRVLKPLSVQSQLELEVDAPFCGYLGYGAGGGGLLVVVDGLLYTVDQVSPHSEFRGILWHQGLRRDLSLVQLVEDEALRLLREQVRALLQRLDGQKQ